MSRLLSARLESLIEEVAQRAPRELIAEAVNLVVHIRRTNEARLIDAVERVNGWSGSQYDLQQERR